MTQYMPPNIQPPYAQGTGFPAPRRTSGMAVASLVCSILGCIPFLPGLVAVLFGVIGIRTTRNPQIAGRGLAIAGLIIGLLSVLGWSGVSGFVGWGYVQSKPARGVAQQFLTDLSAGDVRSAAHLAPSVKSEQLQSISDAMRPQGALQTVVFTAFFVHSDFAGGNTVTLTAVATFASGNKVYQIVLGGQDGNYKIVSILPL